ncbi:hypothetical protein BGZ73_007653 [Actinomortierella ambigua]|nr:hypothetical protein BGZ73_007653 [Actinomortierella ambigua]
MSLSKIFVFTLLGFVAILALSVSAQTPTATNALPSAPPASTPTPTLPSVTNRPTTNYTGPASGDFDSLRSIIQSYATGRASNPGSSPTPKPNGPGSGADKTVMMGSLAVLATMALTAAGFML